MKKITYNGQEFTVDETGYGRYWIHMENGIWEPWTFRIFDRFLQKDTIYIDLGAWIGMTVMYAARLCDRCYAIEPDPVAYKKLTDNIHFSGIANIKTFNEAISNYDGTLTLGNPDPALGNSVTRIGVSANTFQVPCYTLESFVARENLTGSMFIKMDVEGAEEVILRDIEFFRKWKPMLYISTHQKWFVDEKQGMETIRKVGRLYKHCYHNDLWEMSVEQDSTAYVFTD